MFSSIKRNPLKINNWKLTNYNALKPRPFMLNTNYFLKSTDIKDKIKCNIRFNSDGDLCTDTNLQINTSIIEQKNICKVCNVISILLFFIIILYERQPLRLY